MFQTVLVANRGEIACRVIDTLKRLGIRSVAVYSDADAGARHVGMADVAVRLGPAAAAKSYLNISRILAAATAQGANAIHPGYGFLAENASFAAACAEAGIVFIGPGVEALEVMGDKISAKAQVAARGVPVVPGLAERGLTDEQLSAAAIEIGFPALIKPSAGGGGKGMHVVHAADELPDALAAARREAASSFGDDTLFIERFVLHPRHIEVQVLADALGTTIHLGERECSLQRRHQKVIEEAPSVLLDAETRAKIGEAACETARTVGYRGAGTVEFIVSADSPDEFFFMEMNTRLQVEHPVTELVTGIDIVEWQLRIASGERLDIEQADIVLTGHAIEARVYAEDPEHGFLPTGGTLVGLGQPSGEGIRVDSALIEGLVVSSDYDPMLAKVIAWAPDRAGALLRLQAALGDTVTLGVTNNVEFLRQLLADEDVVAGRLDTELIERHLAGYSFRHPDDDVFIVAALVLHALAFVGVGGGAPWEQPRGWRLGEAAASVYRLGCGGRLTTVNVTGGPEMAIVSADGGSAVTATITLDGATATLTVDNTRKDYRLAVDGARLYLAREGASFTVIEQKPDFASAGSASTAPELRSPMPGSVVAVSARDGELVEVGAPVLIIEAMKMEHVMRAPVRGRVSLLVGVGSQVAADEVVAIIEAGEEE